MAKKFPKTYNVFTKYMEGNPKREEGVSSPKRKRKEGEFSASEAAQQILDRIQEKTPLINTLTKEALITELSWTKQQRDATQKWIKANQNSSNEGTVSLMERAFTTLRTYLADIEAELEKNTEISPEQAPEDTNPSLDKEEPKTRQEETKTAVDENKEPQLEQDKQVERLEIEDILHELEKSPDSYSDINSSRVTLDWLVGKLDELEGEEYEELRDKINERIYVLNEKITGRAPESTEKKAPEAAALEAESAEKEAENFKDKIKDLLPEGFDDLTEAQQLLVTRNIQARIVDVVRERGQIQYSEDLRSKKGWAKFKSLFAIKEVGVKNAEAQVFQKLLESLEGQVLIKSDLERLSAQAKERQVAIGKNGKPEIIFADPDSYEESNRELASEFNTAANKFREIPYEWGQEKSGGRKKEYEKARAEYQTAREGILKLDARTMGEETAAVKIIQLDNIIKFDQLLYTHPEVETEFENLSKTAQGKEWKQAGLRILTGGGGQYGAITASGFGLRIATASLNIAAGISAPITGAILGGARGWLRSKATLEERKKGARKGTNDTSKERVSTVDCLRLTRLLEQISSEIADKGSGDNVTGDGRKRQVSKAELLRVRIQHTIGKIERGEVNFGKAEAVLTSKTMLLETLNRAIALSASQDKGTKQELEKTLTAVSSNIGEKIKENQKAFIRKGIRNAAMLGAGVATVGYLARLAGEQWGWWGDGSEKTAEGARKIAQETKPETTPSSVLPKNEFLEKFNPDGSLKGIKLPDPSDHSPQAEELRRVAASLGLHNKITVTPQGPSIETNPLTTPDAVLPTPDAAAEHQILNNFSVKLGEGGVPKNLETVFNAISADHMALPADGTINTEFATKSLNMAANLVKLAEGGKVAGISHEQWAGAANFSNGKLEILDHDKFNQILDSLKGHSDELWSKGALQSKGAAIKYIPKISSDNWLKIVHAEGMDKTIDASGTEIPTGILGHDGIDITKIQNFSESDLVKSATETSGGRSSMEEIEEAHRRLIEKYVPPEIDVPETQAPTAEELAAIKEAEATAAAFDSNPDRPEVEEARGAIYDSYEGELPKAVLAEIKTITNQNLEKIFPEETELMWERVQQGPARIMMKIKQENISDDLRPLMAYLHMLEEKTGLAPRIETNTEPAETIGEYVLSASKMAYRLKILDKIKL